MDGWIVGCGGLWLAGWLGVVGVVEFQIFCCWVIGRLSVVGKIV